jgi:hypothetical protein
MAFYNPAMLPSGCENRVRLLSVDAPTIMEFIRWQTRAMIAMPVFPPLPADAIVLGVNYETRMRSFVFTLAHPSFGEVPLGAQIPFLEPGISRAWEVRALLDSAASAPPAPGPTAARPAARRPWEFLGPPPT